MVGHEARGCEGREGEDNRGGDQGQRELVAGHGKMAFGAVVAGRGFGISGTGEVVEVSKLPEAGGSMH